MYYFVAFFFASLLPVPVVVDGKDFEGAALGKTSSNGFHNT